MRVSCFAVCDIPPFQELTGIGVQAEALHILYAAQDVSSVLHTCYTYCVSYDDVGCTLTTPCPLVLRCFIDIAAYCCYQNLAMYTLALTFE